MKQFTKCNIIDVGKRRDGGIRYWCIEHKADATAKYGKPAKKCRYAHIPIITPDEFLKLNVDDYKGGVALWGAVPPIYDTTRSPIDRGIHVHVRQVADGEKEIDNTYRAVRLMGKHEGIPQGGVLVHEIDAIYYMVTSVFGYPMKYVECTLCRFPHLDKDWFSVHAHRRHLCAGCGEYFRDTDTAIGNPIIKVQEIFGDKAHRTKRAAKATKIRQVDYPGGIQIWGSNPAILWTSSKKEAEGIHVHAFITEGGKPEIDDTFSRVTIDGINIDPTMVRFLMAQSALPHITGRVINVQCTECYESHFDTGEPAFTPHETYTCKKCGKEFRSRGRLRKTIGNPLVGILKRLSQNAPRAPQRHESYLLPETL
jgi:hypothetical protein